jgi:hypothetical protein
MHGTTHGGRRRITDAPHQEERHLSRSTKLYDPMRRWLSHTDPGCGIVAASETSVVMCCLSVGTS